MSQTSTVTSGRLGHGSLVIDRYWNLYVEIGLPAPPSFIPVIPKYTSCSTGPWARPGSKFCRLIERYGPEGIAEALERASLRLRYDPFYSIEMPYLDSYSVSLYWSPREAFASIILKGSNLDEKVLSMLDELRSYGVPISDMGVTGSYGLGIAQSFSDVDLVIYEGSVEKALTMFIEVSRVVECVDNFGGLKVKGYPCVPWRRGLVKGVMASWVGAPEALASHCGPLVRQDQLSGLRKVDTVITVPQGQRSALLYPPCVRSDEGVTLISYEYNVAYALYRGGTIRVSGLGNGNVIVLGSREFPGSIEFLGREP